MSKKKKKYYLVVKGCKPGLYTSWFGQGAAAEQVLGYENAVYKGFYTKEEALAWLKSFHIDALSNAPELLDLIGALPVSEVVSDIEKLLAEGRIVIYTDGGANPNPGPGGYGVVLLSKTNREELSGGFRLTTNNRMELFACIEGLNALKEKSDVILFTDSQYIVKAIQKGWLQRWQKKGWYTKKGEIRTNYDLWEKLFNLHQRHNITFRWVKGHAGNMENERCDELAGKIARQKNLPIDTGYENPPSPQDSQGILF